MCFEHMKAALTEAGKSLLIDEVPIGAVIVYDGKIIASAHNCTETSLDPTAHAEMLAIRRAAEVLGGWRLIGCSIYITLEPCPMCAGAIINSRIEKVFFGAYAAKSGCAGSVYDLLSDGRFNHTPVVTGGVMESECASLLTDYFAYKRK